MPETAAPSREYDHDVPGGGPSVPPPLTDVEDAARRSPAEEARTIMSATTIGTLATLSEDGSPWASVVAFGLLVDGSPVLALSRLAEHGRNAAAEQRASIAVSGPVIGDPLDSARVTLAGRLVKPATATEVAAARAAYVAAVPAAPAFIDFTDFTTWVLKVERVRWVGGYGRMGSTTAEEYALAAPDPVAANVPRAVEHLNDDHADALLDMARNLGGHPDATHAHCTSADRYGLDLVVKTPRGTTISRLGFAQPITEPHGLRSATVELARRARA
ncbi:DUF2470 domain-containing protein [Patulibacter sp. SYSU D01012]|uniref:HugZ family pyridoxamine 5'-phosphate oxidase n=1 Tax=Patulibacter sp. SYSU D01012 TaxID=2817381 RepID=UPI001B313EE0|nr:DUF2470 domain-containing protein [Patulibacter sp. SYSU D01012]